MAEYIDRNLIEWYGCDFENGSCENCECSGCSHANCSHSQVMQIPLANVIQIPEGATNGDMIKAMTGLEFSIGNESRDLMISFNDGYFLAFSINWWNAPYRKVEE